jgi:glycosyltransferase involved in cell wall biosynthesis
MFEGKRVGVVVPAFDEEALIAATLAGIPQIADRILVVDDASTDRTSECALGTGDARVEVVRHERRGGVGAAILTGYRRMLEDGVDVVVVMNGDNQMDPDDFPTLVEPVARGEVDYAKANRLFTGQAWELIPRTRFFGNAILSMLTKVASGYWHVADSQSGYTAISREMLGQLDLDRVYTNYGFPNDMLVHLNVWNARVRDFPSRPIYGVGEQSKMRYRHVVPRIAWLLLRGFFWRLWEKYVKRDFHPLVFFYLLGFVATLAGVLLGLVVLGYRIAGSSIAVGTVVLVALLVLSGSQFTLFAMWFDMESNKDLR